jgi:glutathione S-transferase
MKLYGTSKSRASRCLVLLEELGLEYEHVPLFAPPRSHSDDRAILTAINPNGHIPVLDDGGFIIWESMAINLYLAEKHGGPLWPESSIDRALIYQWSFWSQTEIDRADWNRARRSGDEGQIKADREQLIRALGILDRRLSGRDYLLGNSFTLADLNVATTLSEPHEQGLIGWQRLDARRSGLSALAVWLERCINRPSYKRVLPLP